MRCFRGNCTYGLVLDGITSVRCSNIFIRSANEGSIIGPVAKVAKLHYWAPLQGQRRTTPVVPTTCAWRTTPHAVTWPGLTITFIARHVARGRHGDGRTVNCRPSGVCRWCSAVDRNPGLPRAATWPYTWSSRVDHHASRSKTNACCSWSPQGCQTPAGCWAEPFPFPNVSHLDRP